ncbi:MAG: hypothetical protein LBQ05_00310 [Christensenellaceae bacterium]|jgi:uncharacterized protein YegL|nr:hypothetical protein [Christensenellaceae bacterium]
MEAIELADKLIENINSKYTQKETTVYDDYSIFLLRELRKSCPDVYTAVFTNIQDYANRKVLLCYCEAVKEYCVKPHIEKCGQKKLTKNTITDNADLVNVFGSVIDENEK